MDVQRAGAGRPPGATGDVGYFALWVDDIDRAAQFYAAVLGWEFETEGPTRRRAINAPYRTEITALEEMRGAAWPDRTTPTAFCARQVEDLDAAAERIRAAGGRTQPRRRGILDCVDDQGLPFSVFDDDERYPSGDLAYLTVEVPSIEAAVRFHERVFDWTFRARQSRTRTPGRRPDADDRLRRRSERAGDRRRCSPSTTSRQRSNGCGPRAGRRATRSGTRTARTSDCVDDQGLRFYLGELD